jgi:hypothetical protein
MDLDPQGLPEINKAYENRLYGGVEAEKAVHDYIVSFGLKAIHRQLDRSDPAERLDNFKNGDIEIQFNEHRIFKIDVKRGTFITESSAKGFDGHLFVLLPNGDISPEAIKNARVIKSSTIRAYADKLPESAWKEGLSGKLGYRFGKVKNYMRLEDFCTNLVKAYLNTDQFADPIGMMMEQFNKVLPKGADERFRAR